MPGFYDPNDPLGLNNMPGSLGTNAGNTGVAILARPPVNDPLYNAQNAQLGATQNALNARYGVNAAQNSVFPYSYATLAANRGVLNAQQGTFGPQQGVIDANRGVVGAQSNYITGQRGYIGQQQQENNLQRGEFNAEQSALNNTPDQAAVATFRRYQAVKDARDRALGIAPAQEIYAPAGSLSLNGSVAPGVRVKATTQAEDVARANNIAQTQRGFDLKQAQLAVSLMGTDVDAARNKAAEAGLTLSQAQMLVAQAENQAGYAKLDESGANLGVAQAQNAANLAGLDASQADINVRSASMPPFPGAERWVDPNTGQPSWVTPNEKDYLSLDASRKIREQVTANEIPTQYAISQERNQYATQQEAGGSLLAPYSIDQLLNMYQKPNDYFAPWYEGPRTDVIKNELTRRLTQKGYSQLQAESAADQLIQYELLSRQPKNAKPPPAQELQ